MRTVGEILKKRRLEKKLTLEEAEKHLKIRKKFLQALEENEWDKLPSLPYIKGFLRNYSTYLNLIPEEMVAVFRRQFIEQEKSGIMPKGMSDPLNEPLIHITPQLVVTGIVVFFILSFFGYLFFQYKAYTSPPHLTVTKPQEGEVFTSEKITVEGKTDYDAVLSINNQKIAHADNGQFSYSLTLSEGINTIVIESTNKYGKKTTVNRTIQIKEQAP